MHSGFSVLRNTCAMNCGIRVTLKSIDPPLMRDLHRLEELWADGIAQFGGPFLTGKHFCAVDAFFRARRVPRPDLRAASQFRGTALRGTASGTARDARIGMPRRSRKPGATRSTR
jgi:glutathione S-transferase